MSSSSALQADAPSPTDSPSSVDVRSALERVVTSHAFAASPRHCEFLRYVVERTLDAPGAKINEAAAGVEAFHRDPATFDPRLDPIVRVEALRLRDRLQAYYRTQGAADPVVIDLPRGACTPTFQRRGTDAAMRMRTVDDAATPADLPAAWAALEPGAPPQSDEVALAAPRTAYARRRFLRARTAWTVAAAVAALVIVMLIAAPMWLRRSGPQAQWPSAVAMPAFVNR